MKRLAFSLLLLLSTLGYAGEKVVYSFQDVPDGLGPMYGVIQDKSGNLYGTTPFGGTGSCGNGEQTLGCGTVFELSPDGQGGWAETVLYSFTGDVDGSDPWPLTVDDAGNLYGATPYNFYTGVDNPQCPPSCGSVFELSPGQHGWTFTVLHSFKGVNDGGIPIGGVVLDAAGNLYGNANTGGASKYGTFYELIREKGSWKFKVLHSFPDRFAGPDGGGPYGTPLLNVDGNLYGTTLYGGTYGQGTIYRFHQAHGKWNEKVIYHYGSDSKHLGNTFGDLTSDATGNLYGISQGDYAYQMSPKGGSWKYRNIHHFTPKKDGFLWNSLIADAAGNLYGVSRGGGEVSNGLVYKLAPAQTGTWPETVLYQFRGSPDAAGPEGKLLRHAGKLWGTTLGGGTAGCDCGTVYEITP